MINRNLTKSQPEPVRHLELRERNVAHMWADKQVIRFFRHNLERHAYKIMRDIYLSLCEIDSDFTEERSSDTKAIHAIIKTCSTYSGMNIRHVNMGMKRLRRWKLIDYGKKRTPDGRRVMGSYLTMYKFESWHEDLIKKEVVKEQAEFENNLKKEVYISKSLYIEKPICFKNDIRLNKNLRNKDTKVSNKEAAPPITNSDSFQNPPAPDTSQQITFPQEDDTVPVFTRKLPAPKKEHIYPGTPAWRLVQEWNRAVETGRLPANCHNDFTTKTAERINTFTNQMLRGTFFHRNHFDTNHIEKQLLPFWSSNGHKFTEDDLLRAIPLCLLRHKGGYWPDKKTGVPKSLDAMMYNYRSKKSWLLWALAQPPKPQEPKGSGGREAEIPAIEDMLARKLEGREREQYARALKALREYWLKELDAPWTDLNGKTHVNEDGWRQDIANYIRYLGAIDMDIGPWHFKPEAPVFRQWLK